MVRVHARSARKAGAGALAAALVAVGLSLTGPAPTAMADDGCGTGENWSQPTGEVVLRPLARSAVKVPNYLVYKDNCQAGAAVLALREAASQLGFPQKVAEAAGTISALIPKLLGAGGVASGFTISATVEGEKGRLSAMATAIETAVTRCGTRGIVYRAAFETNGLTYRVSGLDCQPRKSKDLDPDPDLSDIEEAGVDLVLAPEPDSPVGTRCETDEFHGRYRSGTPWGETFLRDRLVGTTATGRLYQRDLWNATTGGYEPDGPPFEDCARPQPPAPPTEPTPDPTPEPTPPTGTGTPLPEPTVVPGPDPTPAPTATPAPDGLAGSWQLCREWLRQDGSSLYSGCSAGSLNPDGSLAFGSSSGCRTSAWSRNGRDFSIEAAGCTTAGWSGDYALSWRGSISDSERTITGSMAATGGPASGGVFTMTR